MIKCVVQFRYRVLSYAETNYIEVSTFYFRYIINCFKLWLYSASQIWYTHRDHNRVMPDDRLVKQLLYGELCYGKRSVGEQKKRFQGHP